MKVLFVDYDGVLLPGNFVRNDPRNVAVRQAFNAGVGNYYDHVFDPACVDRLNRVARLAGCYLVLVTHWKRFYPEDDLAYKKAIEQGVKAKYFHDDHTCPFKMSSHKSYDITMWLRDHPEVTHWMVIDDEVTGYRDTLGWPQFVHDPAVHHVKTTYAEGLTQDKAREIIERFEFAKRNIEEAA